MQMNFYRLLIISLITSVFTALSAMGLTKSDKSVNLPVTFDFGSSASKLADQAILVTGSQLYNEKQGFGLLAEVQNDYAYNSEESITDELVFDGISSDDAIDFRVDLDPGEYWVELFMHGGKFDSWYGEISANGQILADSLVAFSTSFEGDNPPIYWTILHKVSIDAIHLSLKIEAAGQPSTLSAVRVYKQPKNLLYLQDGKIMMSRAMHAPNAEMAVRLINTGNIDEAHRVIDALPESKFGFEKACLLLALAGKLEYENPRPALEWAAGLFKMENNPEYHDECQLNIRLIELYLMADQYYKMAGWDWAKYLTGGGIFTHIEMAGFSFMKIAANRQHPLALQARFQQGKVAFWSWVEQHHKPARVMADTLFNSLLPLYPENKLLRMYCGERIPYKDTKYAEDSGVPPWAFYSIEALNNIRETIHYWVDYRQAENGEFGGKYDDDVEMLRWWPIARMALDDEKTLLGLRRLVDGIWNSPWITDGFSTRLRDVEHSSEPVADTQPMMIGLDYGNPVYVENCMQSIKGLKDLWTGINEKGHRHFKSGWYSYKAIDATPPKDCDVPMNTRTVKSARWLAWYNRHPFAIKFLQEWSDAWLEDCLRTDKGKPYGIVPSAIRYHDDAIGGHADNWHHPGLFWDYLNFSGGADMLQQFLVTYDLTGDTKYLQPIELALDLVAKYEGEPLDDVKIGTEQWVVTKLRRSRGFAETIEKWRMLTEDDRYDHLLRDYGSDYIKFYLTGDLKYIETGSKKVLDGIIYNRELITTDGYFTDRIEIGDLHQGLVLGAGHMESIYTGSSLFEGFYPFYSVTWSGLDDNFAAIVLESSSTHLNILAYNTGETLQTGTLSCWRLQPGMYDLTQGTDTDDDHQIDVIESKTEIEIKSRSGNIPVIIEPGSKHIINLKQNVPAKGMENRPLSDLALIRGEIKFLPPDSEGVAALIVPVHNIGITDVDNIQVELQYSLKSGEEMIDRQVLDQLAAPLDLNPSISVAEFKIEAPDQLQSPVQIRIDPENTLSEITRENNIIELNF